MQKALNCWKCEFFNECHKTDQNDVTYIGICELEYKKLLRQNKQLKQTINYYKTQLNLALIEKIKIELQLKEQKK